MAVWIINSHFMIPDKLDICVPCFSKAAGPSPRRFHVRRVCGGVSRLPGEPPRAAQASRCRPPPEAAGRCAARPASPLRRRGCLRAEPRRAAVPPREDVPHRSPAASLPVSFLGMCTVKPGRPGLSLLSAFAGTTSRGGGTSSPSEPKGSAARPPDLLKDF